MPYFSKFPILKYPVKDGESFRFAFVANILRRVGLSDDLRNREGIFLEYSVKDGERPEQIAERVYGDPSYSWLVLMTNDIIDPYHGWYKSGTVLEDMVRKKHGSTTVFFTNMQDRFLYNTSFGSGCTLWQNTLGGKVLDYFPSMCKVSVDRIGYSVSSGVTTFMEMPLTDTTNYMQDSYAASGLPSGQWNYDYSSVRVYIADETSIPEAKRNEMKAISPYWVKSTKSSAVNGRVVVLDGRSSTSATNSLVQGSTYRIQYYVYSQDSNLTNVRWDTDNSAVSNRVAFTTYSGANIGKVARLNSHFHAQMVTPATSQGNLMVLRTGEANPIGTVLYITGIELNKLNTVDIKPQRVEQSTSAAHHFEITRPTGVCGANETFEVDPLSKETSNYTLLGGVVGSTGDEYPSSTQGLCYEGSGTVAFGETFIGRYMGLCGSQNNTYAISNHKNEYQKNESTRTIKILHPRYKKQATEQLEALLRV